MTNVKIVSKETKNVKEFCHIVKDETVETLLYWVNVALSAHTGVFAQFQYQGSTYVVSIDE
ncbi:MAG: hypothetical protein IIV14_06360 [Bacteroidaceae bacterium]|nr:hypothetical protein [Bacteroidaceae bacterium]